MTILLIIGTIIAGVFTVAVVRYCNKKTIEEINEEMRDG